MLSTLKKGKSIWIMNIGVNLDKETAGPMGILVVFVIIKIANGYSISVRLVVITYTKPLFSTHISLGMEAWTKCWCTSYDIFGFERPHTVGFITSFQ